MFDEFQGRYPALLRDTLQHTGRAICIDDVLKIYNSHPIDVARVSNSKTLSILYTART